MRSESRTEETSGLVTTTATSAWRMASVAPRSMPAGLSQITQSNFSRSSSMTRATPSSVRASLSRVCEAGSSESVSSRLSRISACDELGVALDDVDEVEDDAALGAHDEIEVAQADVEIDHHDVLAALRQRGAERRRRRRLADAALAGCHDQNLGHVPLAPPQASVQRRHHAIASPSSQAWTGVPRSFGGHVVGGLVEAVDRQQLGLELAAEDAGAGIAGRAGDRRGRAARRRRGSSRRRRSRRRRRPSRRRSRRRAGRSPTGRSAPARSTGAMPAPTASASRRRPPRRARRDRGDDRC